MAKDDAKQADAMGRTLADAFFSDMQEILNGPRRYACPYCRCYAGEAACPHWVWTFNGPVFQKRPIEYVTYNMVVE